MLLGLRRLGKGAGMAGAAGKLVLIAALLSGSGCANLRQAWHEREGYYTRNLPDLDDEDISEFAMRQNKIWNWFVALAQANPSATTASGFSSNQLPASDSRPDPHLKACENVGAAPNQVKSTTDGNTVEEVAVPEAAGVNSRPAYSEVVAAGINYVDVRCDRFMDALFWFNRIRETGSRQVQFVSAASAAALTILKASEELIGLAPLGITLVDQTINNIGRGLLYDLPPHTVRSLVEKQQRAYLGAVAKEYTSRPHAMQTIQGYASLCLPATIEAEVSRAVEASEFKAIAWQDPKAPAQVTTTQKADEKSEAPPNGVTNKGTPPPNHVPAVTQGDDD
jgi:hypothetical protein